MLKEAMIIWLPTAVVVGGACLAAQFTPPFSPTLKVRARVLLTAGYCSPVLLVALGMWLANPVHWEPPQQWVEPPASYFNALLAPLALQSLAFIALLIYSRGARARAFGLFLPSIWATLVFILPVSFTVAGVWP